MTWPSARSSETTLASLHFSCSSFDANPSSLFFACSWRCSRRRNRDQGRRKKRKKTGLRRVVRRGVLHLESDDEEVPRKTEARSLHNLKLQLLPKKKFPKMKEKTWKWRKLARQTRIEMRLLSLPKWALQFLLTWVGKIFFFKDRSEWERKWITKVATVRWYWHEIDTLSCKDIHKVFVGKLIYFYTNYVFIKFELRV